jgi:hypothetical protein
VSITVILLVLFAVVVLAGLSVLCAKSIVRRIVPAPPSAKRVRRIGSEINEERDRP